jgi:hypothetical protein
VKLGQQQEKLSTIANYFQNKIGKNKGIRVIAFTLRQLHPRIITHTHKIEIITSLATKTNCGQEYQMREKRE